MFNNKQLEESVVGCIIFDSPACMNTVSRLGITEEHFVSTSIRRIFAACMSLARECKDIDSITVSSLLSDFPEDVTYIETVMQSPLVVSHFDFYAEELCRLWKKRTADQMLANARKELKESHEPSEVLDGIVTASMNINQSTSLKDAKDFHQMHISRRNRAKAKGCSGWPSKWDGLNRLLGGYNAPENVVVAARPSTGKTVMMLDECLNLAMEYNVPSAIVSLDMSEDSIRERCCGRISGVNTFRFRSDAWTDDDAERMDDAYRTLSKLPIYVTDKYMNIEQIVSYAVSMKARYNIGLLAVDFLQLIRKTNLEKRMMTTEVVGDWMATIKSLGNRLNISTLVLSQLNRGEHRNKDVTPPHPSLEALRSSGEIEQDADIVIMMCKKPGEPEHMFSHEYELWDIDFDVAKNRSGPTGLVAMTLWTTRNQFISRESADMERSANDIK